jgi:aspartate/methionine/tyrosine aminotransferase
VSAISAPSRTLSRIDVSKNYMMPGWRIGWALGPRPVMLAMENLHIFNGIMASGFSQVGAAAALSGPQEWQREAVAIYGRAPTALLDEIAASERLSAVPAEGGDRGVRRTPDHLNTPGRELMLPRGTRTNVCWSVRAVLSNYGR